MHRLLAWCLILSACVGSEDGDSRHSSEANAVDASAVRDAALDATSTRGETSESVDAAPGQARPGVSSSVVDAAAGPLDAALLSVDAAASAPDVTTALDCDIPLLEPGDHEFTIQSKNGTTYQYVLVVPSTVRAQQRAPLSLIWPALGSSPEQTRMVTDVDQRAAEAGIYTVHPRSPDASWNLGSCCTGGDLFAPQRDELVFAKELLADVQSKICVDKKRIYTTGFSNGGMMSNMLACKLADVFAAAAPLGGNLTLPPEDCKPARPIPIYMINGEADIYVGYGTPGLVGGGLSPLDTFALWANRDACTGEPELTLQKGAVTCHTYKHCAAGTVVTSCGVEGMGHCLPGMKAVSADNCLDQPLPLGKPNNDINGVQTALEFLLQFSLP